MTLLDDSRYALRVLRKSPTYTLTAIAALALGIGANTAIFSVFNALLLRSLPYGDPRSLVIVWEDASQMGFPRNTPAPGNFSAPAKKHFHAGSRRLESPAPTADHPAAPGIVRPGM